MHIVLARVIIQQWVNIEECNTHIRFIAVASMGVNLDKSEQKRKYALSTCSKNYAETIAT